MLRSSLLILEFGKALARKKFKTGKGVELIRGACCHWNAFKPGLPMDNRYNLTKKGGER